MDPVEREAPREGRTRDAESILRKFGYSRVAPERRTPEPDASFWVQEAGVPRRTYPVFVPPAGGPALSDRIDRWLAASAPITSGRRRAIFVAPTDDAADEAWARLSRPGAGSLEHEVSILVVPPGTGADRSAHFHLRVADRAEVLRVATGVVVGLFRRSAAEDGAGQIDFEEMLQLMRGRFGIDVARSLSVRTDEEALFMLYQLALREAYAPGDPGANLHLLVLKPVGPAARLPWFAA